MLLLTNAGAQQAFDALSGEVHASTQAEIIDDARYARQAMLARLRQMPYGPDAGAMAALGGGGPALSYADPALAYAGIPKGAYAANLPVKAAPLPVAPVPDLVFWAQGLGAWGRIDGDGNAAGLHRDLAGFFTGLDRRFGDWRAGLAAGYTNSNLSVSARASSAKIDTGHVGAYAGRSFGSWNLRTGVDAGFSTVSSNRLIVFPGFSDTANAHYGATTAQVFGELGYGLVFGNVAVEPFAGLAWVHLATDGFAETGGLAALNVASANQDVGYSTLGARFATSYRLSNGMLLTPRASAAWEHAFDNVVPAASLAFQSLGTAFTIAGVPLARDAAVVDAGLDLRVTPQVTVGLSYFGQLANSAQDHSVKGSFSWRF